MSDDERPRAASIPEPAPAPAPLIGSFSDQELGALFEPALKTAPAPSPGPAEPSNTSALSSLAQAELTALSTTSPLPALEDRAASAPAAPSASDAVATVPLPAEPSSQLFHFPAISPPPRAASWSSLPLGLRVLVLSLALMVGALLVTAVLLLRSLDRRPEPAPLAPIEAPPPVSSKPTAPEAAEAPARERLESKDIVEVVLAHRPGIVRCVDAEQERHPEVEGALVMEIRILPSGAVASASAKTAPFRGGELEACLAAEIRSWTFPRHREPLPPIDFPFKL